MKFIYPEINHIFEFEDTYVNVLVIENPAFLLRFLNDICDQVQGLEGHSVLSEKEVPISFSKNLQIIDHYIPFDINQKNLLSKIGAELEKRAMDGENYLRTKSLLSEIEQVMSNLSFEFPCELDFSNIDFASLIKATGMKIVDDYSSLGECIVNYLELTREFISDKLFVFVNLRDFITDEETALFLNTVLSHGFKIFMIESHEHKRIPYEKRYIIDESLCEIVK